MALTVHLVLLLALVVVAHTLSQKDRKTLDDLFKSYQRDKAPSEPEVTNVQVGAYINSIWLDDVKNEMKIRMIFRELWMDERLKFTADGDHTFVVVPKDLEKSFWVPDFYFKTTLNLERYTDPHDQRLMRLSTNGSIWRATAYTVGLLCQMDLSKYPSDSQTCRFEIESFSSLAEQTNITFLENMEPLKFQDDPLVSQEWAISSSETYQCYQKYSTGSYPCVGFKFVFQRHTGRFDRQSHVPFALLLIVAYVSYFISRKNAFLRFGYLFLVGLLLIAAAFSTHMTSSHPNVPYVMVADVWEGVSFFLYFCVVLHSLFVLSLEAKGRKGDEPGPCAFRAQQIDRIGMAAYPITLALWLIVYFAAF